MRWEINQQALPAISIEKGVNKKGYCTIKIEDLALITPMLGGGVDALKNDMDMPIRTQSIRGQLRFWWRTFQDCRTVEELQQREMNLWGSTKEASKVHLAVTVTYNNWRKIPYKKDAKPDATELPKYVIFPLDNSKDDSGNDVLKFELIDGGKFNLTASCPNDKQDEIMKTLGLWYLFGGLGSRTRRGMGSLYSTLWPEWKNVKDVVSWLNKSIPFETVNFQRPWPSIIGARLAIMETFIPPLGIRSLWKTWIEQYQGFRQYRIDKNTGNKKPFGKSTWPEPTAIRNFHLTGKLQKSDFFPRGAYGLPILFHFPQEMDYTLLGRDEAGNIQDRWSSPVILKVTKLSETKAGQICLLLKSPMPVGLEISGHNRSENCYQPKFSFANKHLMDFPPLNELDPYTALIKAMMPNQDVLFLGCGGKQ